jgi:spermidine synthase
MRQIPIYLIFFLSGTAGLGYEILWTRMLSVSLGHEIVSVLAVVCAFFSGLAIGAWFLDRPVSRSEHPQRWYCLFELIIGGWALILIYLIPLLNPMFDSFIGTTPTPFHH